MRAHEAPLFKQRHLAPRASASSNWRVPGVGTGVRRAGDVRECSGHLLAQLIRGCTSAPARVKWQKEAAISVVLCCVMFAGAANGAHALVCGTPGNVGGLAHAGAPGVPIRCILSALAKCPGLLANGICRKVPGAQACTWYRCVPQNRARLCVCDGVS
jgi:hypothetical protein